MWGNCARRATAAPARVSPPGTSRNPSSQPFVLHERRRVVLTSPRRVFGALRRRGPPVAGAARARGKPEPRVRPPFETTFGVRYASRRHARRVRISSTCRRASHRRRSREGSPSRRAEAMRVRSLFATLDELPRKGALPASRSALGEQRRESRATDLGFRRQLLTVSTARLWDRIKATICRQVGQPRPARSFRQEPGPSTSVTKTRGT